MITAHLITKEDHERLIQNGAYRGQYGRAICGQAWSSEHYFYNQNEIDEGQPKRDCVDILCENCIPGECALFSDVGLDIIANQNAI